MEIATVPDPTTTGIEMTATGVVFDSQLSPNYEQIEQAIGQVGRMTRSAQFCLGDLINFAEHEFGSKYDEWMASTGMSYQTLANIACVARNIPFSERSEKLDFHHHQIVAFKLKTNEDRREWLEQAAARRLSTRELECSIKRGKITTHTDLEREREEQKKRNDEKGLESHAITLAKITRWSQDMEGKHGMVDTWEPGVRAQLRQEFEPLRQFMNRLYGKA